MSAGLVTAGRLRGPRFRRLFHDIYVATEVEVTLALRSRAAFLLLDGRGALGGWSAAELLGASCGPRDAAAEVITWSRRRAQPGLWVRHERPDPGELTQVGRITVTTALCTAFDLGRRDPLVDAVVAVDALARVGKFEPVKVAEFATQHRRARGCCRLGEVLRLSNRLSGSPMEIRIRLAVVGAGLPVPVLRHPAGPYLLDLAYPPIRLALEYDRPGAPDPGPRPA